jgi:hypothetical protein
MACGVIGRIKEIREEAPGFKTILLETGDDKNLSSLIYEINAVQGIVNEEALMQLSMKKHLEELEKANSENTVDTPTPAYTEPDPHEVKITTLNGEAFDAREYVEKRNASVKKTTEKKTTTTKSKTKK